MPWRRFLNTHVALAVMILIVEALELVFSARYKRLILCFMAGLVLITLLFAAINAVVLRMKRLP
jgi:hypothetical protein